MIYAWFFTKFDCYNEVKKERDIQQKRLRLHGTGIAHPHAHTHTHIQNIISITNARIVNQINKTNHQRTSHFIDCSKYVHSWLFLFRSHFVPLLFASQWKEKKNTILEVIWEISLLLHIFEYIAFVFPLVFPFVWRCDKTDSMYSVRSLCVWILYEFGAY